MSTYEELLRDRAEDEYAAELKPWREWWADALADMFPQQIPDWIDAAKAYGKAYGEDATADALARLQDAWERVIDAYCAYRADDAVFQGEVQEDMRQEQIAAAEDI
jgi:hypothetical protein